MSDTDEARRLDRRRHRVARHPVQPEWRDAVRLHLRITLDLGRDVLDVPAAGRGRPRAGVPRMSDLRMVVGSERSRPPSHAARLSAAHVVERRSWRASPHAIPVLNAFTAVTAERARARAARSMRRTGGQPVGPLAGVPFAVKNLIDIAGLPTLAGSRINREHPPASADATLVTRLEAPARSWSAR